MIHISHNYDMSAAAMVYMDADGDVFIFYNQLKMLAMAPDRQAEMLNDLLAELPLQVPASKRPDLRVIFLIV